MAYMKAWLFWHCPWRFRAWALAEHPNLAAWFIAEQAGREMLEPAADSGRAQ